MRCQACEGTAAPSTGSGLSMRSAAPPPRRPFCRYPAHGIQHAVRRIHAVQVLRHFRAQKSAGYRMFRIPLDLRGAATLYGDQHSASVGAVVGTRGMDHLFHIFTVSIIEANGGCSTKGIGAASDALILSEKDPDAYLI